MGGVVGRAEEFGDLKAQLGDALHIVDVGVLALGVAAGVEAVKLLAEVGALGVFHEGHVGRLREGEEKFALAALGLGHLCGFVDDPLGETGEVVGGEPDLVGGHLLEHILPEGVGERRQLGAEAAVGLAVLTLEVGALQGEAIVGLLEERLLLGCELEVGAVVVYRLHALPEGVVEGDRCGEVAELGADAVGDLEHLVVGIGRKEREEDVEHAVEVLAVALEGHDGILECGRLGIGSYGVDPLEGEADAAVDSRLILSVGDFAERSSAVNGVEIALEHILCLCHKRCGKC